MGFNTEKEMNSEDKLSRYQRMLEQGLIDPSEFDALVGAIPTSSTHADADRMAAEREVQDQGQGSVKLEGDNRGSINSGPSIESRGGAVVMESVDAGGHFIGRDFIQVISKVVHTDEDPEEARSVIAHYLSALANELAGLKLGEIDVAAKDTSREPLQLSDVYVPVKGAGGINY